MGMEQQHLTHQSKSQTILMIWSTTLSWHASSPRMVKILSTTDASTQMIPTLVQSAEYVPFLI